MGYQCNEEFRHWQRPIQNGQLRSHTLKKKRRTEMIYSKSSGSAKFNEIPREGNGEIPIKSYNDQCFDHIIRNEMWDVFSLSDLCNKDKKWCLFLYQSRFSFDYIKTM